MAKTFEVVVYDDDGKGVTSAITEYDRDDNGVQTYVGQAWLDVDETALVVAVVSGEGRGKVRRIMQAARKCLGASVAYNPRETFERLCKLSDAFRAFDAAHRPSVFSIPWPSREAPGHGD